MVLTRLYTIILAFRYRVNGFLLYLFLKSCGCEVSTGLKVLRLPSFKDIPKRNIHIGKNVSIGRGVIFEIPLSARLVIGNNVTIGDFNRLSTLSEIRIGDFSAFGENVSVRGSFHDTRRNQKIINQGNSTSPINIGMDVLLGAYSMVLQGSEIPDGVIIGAQSLVKKTDQLTSYDIFAGSPLKLIRNRE